MHIAPSRLAVYPSLASRASIMLFVLVQVMFDPDPLVVVGQCNRHSEWHEAEWCSDNRDNHEWLELLQP